MYLQWTIKYPPSIIKSKRLLSTPLLTNTSKNLKEYIPLILSSTSRKMWSEQKWEPKQAKKSKSEEEVTFPLKTMTCTLLKSRRDISWKKTVLWSKLTQTPISNQNLLTDNYKPLFKYKWKKFYFFLLFNFCLKMTYFWITMNCSKVVKRMERNRWFLKELTKKRILETVLLFIVVIIAEFLCSKFLGLKMMKWILLRKAIKPGFVKKSIKFVAIKSL